MNSLITREHNGAAFTFREDGYFNMTKAAAHFNRRLDHFLKTVETNAYIAALADALNSPEKGDKGIIQVTRGNGQNPQVGTYAHPKLAVFFARWLDVRFAVWCDMQIDDILHGRSVVVPVQQAQAPAATLTMEQVNEAIRAAVAPLEQRIAGLLAAPEDDVKKLKAPIPDDLQTAREFLTELVGYTKVNRDMVQALGKTATGICMRQGVKPIMRKNPGKQFKVSFYPKPLLEEAYALMVTQQ